MRFNKRKKSSLGFKIWFGIVAIVIIALIFTFIYMNHSIETVLVEGNIHYTEEEIKKLVFDEGKPFNTLYIEFMYGDEQITDIPFIEQMEVKVEWPNTVHIIVYEKRLAGYVSYLGENLYFDRDGIIVESTNVIPEQIPHITGLHFSHMVLYDELQVEEEGVFFVILDLTKILQKYELYPTEIYFASENDVVIYFDQVRVKIGETIYLDEKLSSLKEILPNIEGKSGEISLEKYKGESKTLTFKED
jgi:cell division protein FtsQ